MALADVFQVVDYQRFPSGEPCQNVYFYQRLDPAGDASDLLAAFEAEVKTDLKACQSGDLVHYLLRVINLGNVADFDEFSTAGDVGGIGQPIRNTFDAVNMTLRPSARTVRPGSKRFAGIPEDDASYTNGVIVGAAHLTRWQTLRVALGALLVGSLAQYQPVIIKRIPSGGSYRLPETDLELVAVPVAQVLFNPRITHQISRGNQR